MANQKVDHSDITMGGNGPFPQKRTPLPLSPNYRQLAYRQLAYRQSAPPTP